MRLAKTTAVLKIVRFGAGYAAAVFAGMMGLWATLDIEEAVTYGRLPHSVLLFPEPVLIALRLTVEILPIALLLAAPFTLLATFVLIRKGWRRWWHFAIAGAACPLSGIILLELLTLGRFFNGNETFLAIALIPTGIISALLFWLIAFRPSGVPAT